MTVGKSRSVTSIIEVFQSKQALFYTKQKISQETSIWNDCWCLPFKRFHFILQWYIWLYTIFSLVKKGYRFNKGWCEVVNID